MQKKNDFFITLLEDVDENDNKSEVKNVIYANNKYSLSCSID